MKNLFITIFSVFLLVSCSTDDELDVLITSEKENYIKSNVLKVLSLEKSDIEEFKRVMKLDEAGNLTSWDNALLEKVYNTTEDYTAVLTHIISELGGGIPERIIVVDEDNTERVYYPLKTVENESRNNTLSSGRDYRVLKGYVNRQDGGCTVMSGTCVVQINEEIRLEL